MYQILVFEDETDIVARSHSDLKETFNIIDETQKYRSHNRESIYRQFCDVRLRRMTIFIYSNPWYLPTMTGITEL